MLSSDLEYYSMIIHDYLVIEDVLSSVFKLLRIVVTYNNKTVDNQRTTMCF